MKRQTAFQKWWDKAFWRDTFHNASVNGQIGKIAMLAFNAGRRYERKRAALEK